MRIAIISDFHLGYARERSEKDAFENAFQAMQTALEKNSDLIILCGDIFDKDEPSAEALIQAFEIFSLARNRAEKEIKISGEKNTRTVKLNGTPIIAIHGTHEFRPGGSTNYLKLYERAGFIGYIHAEKAVIEKNNERIAIHGLGGVPEKKALDALKLWNPRPEENAFNILALHQSLKEFLPFDDEMVATLSVSDLPEGFDLIANGHLHWNNELSEGKKRIILPGSTITTQLKKLESEKPKGFYIIDSVSGEAEFLELKNQRKFYYKKISLENITSEQALEKIEKTIESLLMEKKEKKPLVRIKISGTLAKGHSQENINLKEIEEKFKEKAIVSIDSRLFQESFSKKLSALSELQQEKKSIIELGLEMLEKNLAETSFENAFDAEKLFRLLEKNELEKARELVLEKNQGESKKIEKPGQQTLSG